jgi:RecG-like helicase
MLKKLVERLTKPVEESDREKLSEYCDARLLEPMDAIESRRPIRVGGEVRAVRIVPRAGAPALEVTVTDGRGAVVGVFLGRRKVAGMSPGRRVALEGVAAKNGNQFVLVNPTYELLT